MGQSRRRAGGRAAPAERAGCFVPDAPSTPCRTLRRRHRRLLLHCHHGRRRPPHGRGRSHRSHRGCLPVKACRWRRGPRPCRYSHAWRCGRRATACGLMQGL
eukprot:347328-Chlamydomonas_euryale.AAC.1